MTVTRRPILLAALALTALAGPVGAAALGTGAATEEVCVLETSLGKMVFRFFDSAAPLTTRNVRGLPARDRRRWAGARPGSR